MTDAPTLNGRTIGQAERATRAVFDRLLAETGTTFLNWVVINLTADVDGPVDQPTLVNKAAASLPLPHAAVADAVHTLVTTDVLTTVNGDPDLLDLSATGRATFEEITAGIAAIAARLYGDLPHDDLVTAQRVLTTVTERADAELAAGA